MNSTTPSTTSSSTASSLIATSTLVVAAAVSALWVIKAQAQKKVESPIFPGIPYAPGANWVFGHMVMLNGASDFTQGYHKVFVEFADPESGLCSFWFLNRPTMCILLSHHVKTVLNSSSYRAPLKLIELHTNNFLGEKALTSLMGKEWRLYRTTVHKSFTPRALKQAQSAINRVGNTLADSLLEAIKKTKTGELQEHLLPFMKMATMDVFGFAVLDADFECCQKLKLTAVASAFEHLTSEYTRRLTQPWDPTSWLYFVPTAANREQRAQRNVIRTFIAEQITKTRSQLNQIEGAAPDALNQKHNLLANILRAAKAEDGTGDSEMSDDAISDILMTLLFGGYDTTAITLSYAIYLLAKHPDIQTKCLREIQSVLPTDEATEMLEGPEKLQYTRAVILETLRLFPPAPLTIRTTEKLIELHGHVVEKGTSIFVPIWSIQRDARNFPLPDQLRPERWVRPIASSNGSSNGWEERPSNDMESCHEVPPANKDAFCVFAAGARNCVGQKLAMQEAITLLALLIRKLKFEVIEDGYQAKPILSSVVQQPDGGLPMVISARW